MTNKERGERLRASVNALRDLEGRLPAEHQICWLCDDLFRSLPRFAEAAAEAMGSIGYDTFLIGTRVEVDIADREERLWGEIGSEDVETIKAELNREIGKLVYSLTDKDVEFDHPDVVAVVDTRFAAVELDVSPVFIYGRYLKRSREIPQTRWPCTRCRGRGCERCHGTGKMYSTSVQEMIGDPARAMLDGVDHAFHGMGREDIDARMLGIGRPFVLEVSKPRTRDIDLAALEEAIRAGSNDDVGVLDLRMSDRSEVRRIKSVSPNKSYRAQVRVDGKLNKELVIGVVRSFKNARITQRTPSRVAHRRADKDRVREIVKAFVEDIGEDVMTLTLETEAGTYVKEFVSGDEGRTRPSLSEKLGVPCRVEALDVIAIHDQEV